MISHPDAGKSTLTEALALHAQVIEEAGAVHGKAGRGAVSRLDGDGEGPRHLHHLRRAAVRLPRRVINLLDTPGHADFSEDTYRVLAAVDAAVMLLDAAKGLEPQTLKLFDVCRHRGIPVHHLRQQVGPARPRGARAAGRDRASDRPASPMPLTWPVGIAGDFRGVLDRATGEFVRFTRTAGGATDRARGARPRRRQAAARRRARPGDGASRRASCSSAMGQVHDQATLPRRRGDAGAVRRRRCSTSASGSCSTPWSSWRRRPDRAPTSRASRGALDAPFSAFVFKVQAGMDTAHRDRLAFVRVCSGVFERGMVVTHAATGKPFATKYAQPVFGRDRATVDVAYPGDVVGLVNASALRVGDTLYVDEPVDFPPIPSFAPGALRGLPRRRLRPLQAVPPRHRAARAGGRRAGAALGPARRPGAGARRRRADAVRGRRAPHGGGVLRAGAARPARVHDGPAHRPPSGREVLDRESGVEVLERASDGALLALFAGNWRLQRVLRDHPDAVLEPLVAASTLIRCS